MKAILIDLQVTFPVFPLVNVGGTELPVLFRLIDALKESLSLLFIRKVQEYLDGLRVVVVKVLLQVNDGVIPLLPEILLVTQLIRQSLAAQNLRMHTDDQHFLVIGTVEDADPAALGKPARAAPEKIVLEFFGAGLLETVDRATLWVDA